jgi:hypothetical protein
VTSLTVMHSDGSPDQQVEIPSQDLTAIVFPGELEVVASLDYVVIGPEETVECIRTLEADQWEVLKDHDKFKQAWQTLWEEVPVPPVIHKASVACRHAAGMILLLFMARAGRRKIHLKLPETYLHPRQVARLMLLVNFLTGRAT